MQLDVVVRNGTIVTPFDSFSADLGIVDGQVYALEKRIAQRGKEEIDAAGLMVLPGIIDVHTHMQHTSGEFTTVDDFAWGTMSAAAGGVTTFIDFAPQKRGVLPLEALSQRIDACLGKAYIDFSLHLAFMDINDQSVEQVADLVAAGVPTFKVFMTYRKEGFMTEDAHLLALMEKAKEHGAMVGVHAENDSIVEFLTKKYGDLGQTSPVFHALSRPHIVEVEAIQRAILFARVTGCRLYIFHLTTKGAIEIAAQAQKNNVSVLVETNPHYLLLDEDRYMRDDGHKYIMSPPLRKEEDQAALWQGIKDKSISVVSSDHCPYRLQHKDLGKSDFRKVPPGIPGTELVLPLIYSEGVHKHGLTLNRVVELLSYNPARIFGIYPKKGHLGIGADADLVLFNPLEERIIDARNMHSASDYSPFDGLRVKGFTVQTILRGKTVFKNGKIVGEKGAGQFIKRTLERY